MAMFWGTMKTIKKGVELADSITTTLSFDKPIFTLSFPLPLTYDNWPLSNRVQYYWTWYINKQNKGNPVTKNVHMTWGANNMEQNSSIY